MSRVTDILLERYLAVIWRPAESERISSSNLKSDPQLKAPGSTGSPQRRLILEQAPRRRVCSPDSWKTRISAAGFASVVAKPSSELSQPVSLCFAFAALTYWLTAGTGAFEPITQRSNLRWTWRSFGSRVRSRDLAREKQSHPEAKSSPAASQGRGWCTRPPTSPAAAQGDGCSPRPAKSPKSIAGAERCAQPAKRKPARQHRNKSQPSKQRAFSPSFGTLSRF